MVDTFLNTKRPKKFKICTVLHYFKFPNASNWAYTMYSKFKLTKLSMYSNFGLTVTEYDTSVRTAVNYRLILTFSRRKLC